MSSSNYSGHNGTLESAPTLRRLIPDQLFLSAITVGELTKGIVMLPVGKRRQELTNWLIGLEQRFGEKILPVNSEVARR